MSENINPTSELVESSKPVDTTSLMALANIIGGSSTPFYTSIATATSEGQDLLFKVSESGDHKVDDKIGDVINLQHLYMSKAQKIDAANGEVTDLVRTVLIDVNGTSYECFSEGVAESVRKLIGVYGMPPWRTGLKVRLEKQRTASGRIRFFLTRVVTASVKKDK